jgi:hypothetical protein
MQEQTHSTILQQQCPQGKFSALSPPERSVTTSKDITRSAFLSADLIDLGQTMRAIFEAVTIEQQRGWPIASRAASNFWLRYYCCRTLRSSQTERARFPIGTSRYFAAMQNSVRYWA